MSSAVNSSTAASSSPSSLITSTGIGSGLDISAIVSSLTSAYGAAQTNELSAEQTSLNAQVSAFGTFSSALSTLQATLSSLETPSTLAGYDATVADKTIASASTSSDAVPGQYSLEVQNLATAATLTSAPVASGDTTIGTGTLTVAVGSSLHIDHHRLDQRHALGHRLGHQLGNQQSRCDGERHHHHRGRPARAQRNGDRRRQCDHRERNRRRRRSLRAGLSAHPARPASRKLRPRRTPTIRSTAIAATSANNVVSGAISGVTLDLLGQSAANTPTTLTISADTTAASTSIGTFVTAVNGVLSAIQSLGGYDASTQTAGPLNGNATLESFQNQLENILGQVKSGNTSGVASLADLGITADANTGQLDTNSTSLSNALSANLTAVGNLLGGSNGIATQLNTLINQYTGAGGLLTTINQGLQSSLSNVSQQQTALQAELATYSATLTSEYNAMDAAVAALKETQTYLNAEFNPNQSSSSSSSSPNSSLSSGTLGT